MPLSASTYHGYLFPQFLIKDMQLMFSLLHSCKEADDPCELVISFFIGVALCTKISLSSNIIRNLS